MTQGKPWVTFVRNDDELLWLALTARSFGQRPSELAEISNPTYAIDFDLTCGLRLLTYDNEREADRFEMFKAAIKIGIAEFLTGKNASEPSEDAPELSEDDIL